MIRIRYSSMLSLDGIGSLLSNSVESRHQVTTDLHRKNRSIDDANVLSAIDKEITVDDTAKLTRHHSRSGDVVVVGSVRGLDPLSPLCLGCIGSNDIKTGSRLSGDVRGECVHVAGLSSHLASADLLLDIVVEEEVVGVDRGGGTSVGGVDVDVATGEGKQTPVGDGDGGVGRSEEDLRNGKLVIEDEAVLDSE